MLDLGFLPDVERILQMTPETRQTMLFSATMPAAIVSLARTHMRHPMNIRAESSYDTQLVPATAQFIYQAHDLDKPEMIGRILQAEDADKIIVFTRTKRQAQRVADDLAERGFSASAAARRHGPGGPREGADQVPRGQDPGAGRDRRRRPRHRRRGRLARHQLHLPRGRQDLRPPDRPHRPRRRDRHRDHLRRLGGPAPLEDDQQDARPAVRRAAGDLLDLRAPLPRPGHPAGHQGPDRRPRPGRAQAARGPPGGRRSQRPAATERPRATATAAHPHRPARRRQPQPAAARRRATRDRRTAPQSPRRASRRRVRRAPARRRPRPPATVDGRGGRRDSRWRPAHR